MLQIAIYIFHLSVNKALHCRFDFKLIKLVLSKVEGKKRPIEGMF